MINLFKIKGQKREEAANAIGRGLVKKQSAGELRLNKGIFFFNYFCLCMNQNSCQ
jgi:ubiquitin-conjugating enzyme E2 M